MRLRCGGDNGLHLTAESSSLRPKSGLTGVCLVTEVLTPSLPSLASASLHSHRTVHYKPLTSHFLHSLLSYRGEMRKVYFVILARSSEMTGSLVVNIAPPPPPPSTIPGLYFSPGLRYLRSVKGNFFL